MIINLLMVFLMIAALCGMIWCNRRRTQVSKSGSQVIALLLLVLVLVSGGTFVIRLGTLSLLGLESDLPVSDDRQFSEARGAVVGAWIARQFPESDVLLLTDPAHRKMAAPLQNGLRAGGVRKLTPVTLRYEQPTSAGEENSEDHLILSDEESGITAAQIDQAVKEHPECKVVVIACVPSEGEILPNLEYLKKSEFRRPATVLVGVNNLNEWAQECLRSGRISAMVVEDLSKLDVEISEEDKDAKAVFALRYVLITKDNLQRNRRFFR